MGNHPNGARARQSDRWDTSGRIYERDGRRYTSVTTLINDGYPKPALVGWAAKMTALYAVEHPGAPLDELKAARHKQKDEASGLGTALHRWVESWALSEDRSVHPLPEPMSPEQCAEWDEAFAAGDPHHKHDSATEQRRLRTLRKMAEQWVKLAAKHTIEPLASEFTVYHEALGYAGTADMVALVDGIPSLIDVKTGKDVYAEAALQLCALARGEYIGVHNGPTLPMPEFDRCLVAHVRPTFARFYPVDYGDWAWRTFRAARAISQWVEGPAKGAVLPALDEVIV
jgi:hypothetical protein